MAFINKDDILNIIESRDLEEITKGDDTIIEEEILNALELVSEKLRNRYDLDYEFNLTGTDRNRQLLKQSVSIAMFYISERIPTNFMPESRQEAFDRAESWLLEVDEGKRNVNLRQLDAENQVGFPLRWGSTTLRTNKRY